MLLHNHVMWPDLFALVLKKRTIIPSLHLVKLNFLWFCNRANSWVKGTKVDWKVQLKPFECHPNKSRCLILRSIVELDNTKLSVWVLLKDKLPKARQGMEYVLRVGPVNFAWQLATALVVIIRFSHGVKALTFTPSFLPPAFSTASWYNFMYASRKAR